MSYDITMVDGVTGEVMEMDAPWWTLQGGTYSPSTCEAWLSVTYNYSRHYCRVFPGEEGIRTLYGMTGADSIPVLEAAIAALGDDVDEDYWQPTEGNAKRALVQLQALAEMFPAAVWEGD